MSPFVSLLLLILISYLSRRIIQEMSEYAHVSLDGVKTTIPFTPEQEIDAKNVLGSARKLTQHMWDVQKGHTLINFFGSSDHKFWQFRFEELEALGELFGGDSTRIVDSAACNPESPFIFGNFPSDEVAQQVVQRAIMVRGVYKCYARALSLEDLVEQVKKIDRTELAPYLDGESYRYDITSFANTYTQDQKQEIRDKFSFLEPKGKVQFTNPSNVFTIFVEHIHMQRCPIDHLRQNVTHFPAVAYYFCRPIAEKESWWVQYDLKKRPYIGPTSCDAPLAFLMANMGKVSPQDLVFDPFVGTGSILIAAAKFGACVMGQDLDWRVIHGRMRGKQSTIFDNFRHYNFPRPDLVCSDNALPAWRMIDQPRAHAPQARKDPRMVIVKTKGGVPVDEAVAAAQAELWVQQKKENDARKVAQCEAYNARVLQKMELNSDSAAAVVDNTAEDAQEDTDNVRAPFTYDTRPPRTLWDVILSDPPYGIRAGARRLGAKKEKAMKLMAPEHAVNAYVPQTKPYPVEEVMWDLLHFAAKTLKVGGRLVYLLPTNVDFRADELPTHPCLRCVFNCNQPLQNPDFSRRAITMEKTRAFDPMADNEWMAKQRALPPPRWALLSETVFAKESGQVKENGRVHYTRSDRKKRREERAAAGLPVKNLPTRKRGRGSTPSAEDGACETAVQAISTEADKAGETSGDAPMADNA